ncbi:MAG: hypothetical protein V1811_03505 [Candidatus Micrarchaeota archaeon]
MNVFNEGKYKEIKRQTREINVNIRKAHKELGVSGRGKTIRKAIRALRDEHNAIIYGRPQTAMRITPNGKLLKAGEALGQPAEALVILDKSLESLKSLHELTRASFLEYDVSKQFTGPDRERLAVYLKRPSVEDPRIRKKIKEQHPKLAIDDFHVAAVDELAWNSLKRAHEILEGIKK